MCDGLQRHAGAKRQFAFRPSGERPAWEATARGAYRLVATRATTGASVWRRVVSAGERGVRIG